MHWHTRSAEAGGAMHEMWIDRHNFAHP
jgi:hypothetical protein